METKICSQCQKEKPLEEFSKRTKTTYRAECKDCKKLTQQKIELQHKQETRDYIKSIKTNCAKCGETRHYLIDFHHINPLNKEIQIAAILSTSLKFEKRKILIDNEVSKCIQLCSNCHREFHHLEKENNITIQEYLK